jgi:hypothetical protein
MIKNIIPFPIWMREELMKEIRKNCLNYFIYGQYEKLNGDEIYENKRTDYIFALLNPEE